MAAELLYRKGGVKYYPVAVTWMATSQKAWRLAPGRQAEVANGWFGAF